MNGRPGVLVLGATGSIGQNTAKVLAELSDRFHVVGLVGRTHLEELARQAALLHPDWVVTTDESRGEELAALLPAGCRAAGGMAKVLELAAAPETDTVVVAIVGTAGLEPTLAAIRAGKRLALASKEVMVMAGELVNRELAAHPGSRIVPVDSEHSALYQLLEERPRTQVKKLWLTASGGAFRDWKKEDLARATVKDALAHPTWSMGRKVTIDSATLMNKALELVEARFLFNFTGDELGVIIHPQSIVHSMIELADGAWTAQLSRPDMRFAIRYALTWPERPASAVLPQLDFTTRMSLEFYEPDETKYPSLGFAREALKAGGTLAAVMNAANEVAVDAFVAGKIGVPKIWDVVEKTMAHHVNTPQTSLAVVREADTAARAYAASLLGPVR